MQFLLPGAVLMITASWPLINNRAFTGKPYYTLVLTCELCGRRFGDDGQANSFIVENAFDLYAVYKAYIHSLTCSKL